ncbi:hypothetical protein [Synechocystis sp. PCC 7509]|uniref:hypothetical protein n=1 Tax=Synechocystis sp. PCC 7509 TaxID=927677 RepID=UPI0002AC14DF|nr:hypothetical protein [Synechocystis sp. PCC 7509]
MTGRILLKGNSKLLKPIITEVMAINQLLNNLEIGEGGSRSEMHPNRRFKPQIRLHFLEDTDFKQVGSNPSTYQGLRRSEGRLTFRIMNETSETISKSELTRIATSIKNIFGSNGGYVWTKGKELYTYADWDKGYQLQVLARSSAQPRDLVTKILSLQNHTPEWIWLTKSGSESESERYPELIQTKTILGEQVKLPKVRPLVDVRFSYADARVHSLIHPIMLFALKGNKMGALVTP